MSAIGSLLKRQFHPPANLRPPGVAQIKSTIRAIARAIAAKSHVTLIVTVIVFRVFMTDPRPTARRRPKVAVLAPEERISPRSPVDGPARSKALWSRQRRVDSYDASLNIHRVRAGWSGMPSRCWHGVRQLSDDRRSPAGSELWLKQLAGIRAISPLHNNRREPLLCAIHVPWTCRNGAGIKGKWRKCVAQ